MKKFPKNKSAQELGIDTTRRFVVVGDIDYHYFDKGDVVELVEDDGTDRLKFKRISDGREQWLYWSHLAYADKQNNLKNTMSNYLNKLSNYAKKKLDKNTRTLCEAGLLNESLELTGDGEAALIEILAEEFEEQLVERGKEIIKERE